MEIKILQNILGANDRIAADNRRMLDSHGIYAVNIMASPGAGKTSLILETIRRLKARTRIGVIEGDISSDVDAVAVGRESVPVVQINTGGQCHLDANMLNNGLANFSPADIDLLLIENVGNLVCPAEFSLGENLKVLIAHTAEGDDKPYKYPLMFHTVDALIVNKIDLLPHVSFDLDAFTAAVRAINERVVVFPLSCTTGEGVDAWTDWLREQMSAFSGARGEEP